MARRRDEPMVVKYWSRAGLMLTDWCNARCACCYGACGPDGQCWMAPEQAVAVWADLVAASPHGCRVHLTGGEPFGRFEYLLGVCQAARREGLGPLEAIETNGYWARDEAVIRERLRALDAAGMERLSISADPYHQQFVPIEHPRRLAVMAEELLGPARVRVRWADWLRDGADLIDAPPERVQELLTAWAGRGRDRLTGRAAWGLDAALPLHEPDAFAGMGCGPTLLRGKHVHVAATGDICLATCVGVSVGNAFTQPVAEIWQKLNTQWAQMPIIGELCGHGPVGLWRQLAERGELPRRRRFASKCHLCDAVRREWARSSPAGLGPWRLYGAG